MDCFGGFTPRNDTYFTAFVLTTLWPIPVLYVASGVHRGPLHDQNPADEGSRESQAVQLPDKEHGLAPGLALDILVHAMGMGFEVLEL